MFTFYVKIDPASGQVQGIPSPETFDGAIEVKIDDAMTKEYFTRWPQGYAIKNGQLIAPGWAPDITIDGLLATINQQVADINNLKSIQNQATQAQVEAMQSTQQDSSQIKAQLNSVTQQLVAIMQAVTPAPTTKEE